MTGAFATKIRAAFKRAIARTASQQGETLVETLVSLLIGGLALLMMAVAISAAVNMVSDSGDSMADYYTDSNAIALASSSAGVETASGTVQLVNSAGNAIDVKAGQAAEQDVTYIVGDAAGKKVVSYVADDGATGGSGGGNG